MAASSPKTQPTKASVADFIAGIADAQRQADCRTLDAMMQRVTGEAPVMWGSSIVGFGAYRSDPAKARSGTWPVAAFSPRKNDLTVYVMPGFDRFGALLEGLGRHRIGKSCLYLKRLADVDLAVLENLVAAGVSAMAAKRTNQLVSAEGSS